MIMSKFTQLLVNKYNLEKSSHPNKDAKLKEVNRNIKSIMKSKKSMVSLNSSDNYQVQMRCVGDAMVYQPISSSVSSGTFMEYFPLDGLNN